MSSELRSPQLLTSTLRALQVQISSQIQPSSPEHRSNGQCSPLVFPVVYYSLYPSSTLQNYYPNPLNQNYVHISSPPLLFLPVIYGPLPLPSALQSCIPTLRGTPSSHSICQLNLNIEPQTPPIVQYTSPLLSPLCFPQPFSSPSMNILNSPRITLQPARNASTPHDSLLFSLHPESNLHTPHNVSPICQEPLFLHSSTTVNSQPINPIALPIDYPVPASFENHCSPFYQSQHSPSLYFSSEDRHSSTHSKTFLKFTLPSTKDIPIPNGKHNWGPWHMAV
jgi:hypothetical protein